MNGFIERERERLQLLLYATKLTDPNRAVIEAASQALAWASDPECFMSPTGWLHKFYGVGASGIMGTGIQVGLPTAKQETLS